MANREPTKTSFSKDNQPKKGRGKSERTKILESMERLGKTEEGFYDVLVGRAYNPEDNFSFAELLKRISPIPKAVSPFFEYDFDETKELHEQSGQILKAISLGKLPPDVGALILGGVTSMLKIKEITDIDDRLKAMESKIDAPE